MGGGSRRHTARRPETIRPDLAWLTSDCPSKLPAFTSRAAARKVARKSYERGIRAFSCPACQYTHLGAIPDSLRQGDTTRRHAAATLTTPPSAKDTCR